MRSMSTAPRNSTPAGFTLVEVLVIAPVVLIVIGVLVGMIIALVGSAMATSNRNAMVYNNQDALDRIEQDVRLSARILPSTGSSNLTTPQGSDTNFTGTAPFTASSSVLVLDTVATTKNPADSTRQPVFYANTPNPCGAQQSSNQLFLVRVVYFVSGGSLWRRTLVPVYNTNTTSPNASTVCNAPWQRNTCSPGQTLAQCQTSDSEIATNVGSFNVKYLANSGSTIDLGSSGALSATALEVTINGQKSVSGRDITASSTVRATKINNIDSSQLPPFS